MKKTIKLPIAFCVCLYFCLGWLFLSGSWDAPFYMNIWILSILVSIGLGFANMIQAIIQCKKGNAEYLFSSMKLLKLALIPFYLVFFVYALGIGFVLAFVTGPFALLFFMWIDYCILFVGAVSGICYLIVSAKQGRRTKGKAFFHSLLQLSFVLDVVDTLYLSARK